MEQKKPEEKKGIPGKIAEELKKAVSGRSAALRKMTPEERAARPALAALEDVIGSEPAPDADAGEPEP